MSTTPGAQARHQLVLRALAAAGRRPTLESLFLPDDPIHRRIYPQQGASSSDQLQLPPYADNPCEDGLPPVLDPERAS